MGMKLDYLEFKDNIRIYYINKDRKRHVVIPEGCSFSIKERSWPMNNVQISSRRSKMTYNQWKGRWAT